MSFWFFRFFSPRGPLEGVRLPPFSGCPEDLAKGRVLFCFFGVGSVRCLSSPSPGVASHLRHGCFVASGRSQGCDVGVFAGAWVRFPCPGVLGRTLNCQLPLWAAACLLAFRCGGRRTCLAPAVGQYLPGRPGGNTHHVPLGRSGARPRVPCFCGTARPGAPPGRRRRPALQPALGETVRAVASCRRAAATPGWVRRAALVA